MRAPFPQVGWVRLTLIFAIGVLAGCSDNEAPDDETNPVRAPEIARIVPASEALAGADIPTLDPATMNDAEIEKALGTGPHCEFRYTSEGKPVLAVKALPDGAAAQGVVKLNGSLVVLRLTSTNGKPVLVAGEVRMTLTSDQGGLIDEPGNVRLQEASSIFEIGRSLRVGYRGYYDCLD